MVEEVTSAVTTHCMPVAENISLEMLSHHFGAACHKLRFIADEASAKRILTAVSREINERRRALDRLNGTIVRSTCVIRRRSPQG